MIEHRELREWEGLGREQQAEQLVRWRDEGRLDRAAMQLVDRYVGAQVFQADRERAGRVGAWVALRADAAANGVARARNTVLARTPPQSRMQRAVMAATNPVIRALEQPHVKMRAGSEERKQRFLDELAEHLGVDASILALAEGSPADAQVHEGELTRTHDLDKVRAQVAKVTDSMGLGIDPNIQPLVASLVSWGVHTNMSCEGHAAQADHQTVSPWVSFPSEDAPIVARLLAESGGNWTVHADRGYGEMELRPDGLVRSRTGLRSGQRSPEQLLQMQQRGYARARQLASWLDALPDHLQALGHAAAGQDLPELSDMERAPEAIAEASPQAQAPSEIDR
jgi:hypothetical protein